MTVSAVTLGDVQPVGLLWQPTVHLWRHSI